jgi:hypothetical protein
MELVLFLAAFNTEASAGTYEIEPLPCQRKLIVSTENWYVTVAECDGDREPKQRKKHVAQFYALG